MDKGFWHERWQRREIGFHQSDIHWALNRHWADISPTSHECVLVPLCGKSLDMHWLAERAKAVTGIELSGRAIDDFFLEWDRSADASTTGGLPSRQAAGIELAEGDFLDFRPDEPFGLFYDRAALVALPQVMRERYLSHLRECLGAEARGLLVTFEYDPGDMNGPPFPVSAEELLACERFDFELLERRDVLRDHQAFAERGLDALFECAWRVTCI